MQSIQSPWKNMSFHSTSIKGPLHVQSPEWAGEHCSRSGIAYTWVDVPAAEVHFPMGAVKSKIEPIKKTPHTLHASLWTKAHKSLQIELIFCFYHSNCKETFGSQFKPDLTIWWSTMFPAGFPQVHGLKLSNFDGKAGLQHAATDPLTCRGRWQLSLRWYKLGVIWAINDCLTSICPTSFKCSAVEPNEPFAIFPTVF